ncbi:putative MAPEG superfamily protein [Rhodovulum bhavnagarense]|uniref:Putative MAPEG superfamily protein n=1 Tax=Rhodovulum bhavnagarense TaxID=992286 RepID=A0A4R2RQV2_9RHOB|nr:MAPEG family protein [Rhodovulum bhavnagarense]TCP62221.1 putative MAPEG superfamily protein [Rhodovulum bhavnagarense]
MTPELYALALAILVQAVQFALLAIPANMELGTKYTLSPRDEPPTDQLSRQTARAQRALNNHFEGLILFTAAVVLITVSEQSTWFTALCAWIYLAARIAYVPAYTRGWVPARSLIWTTGFAATILMTLAALL